MRRITIGSRRSDLAITQTNWVIKQLQNQSPDLQIDVEKIVTKGDRILDVTLSKVGGKGLFVKEIEQALFDRRIDMAVHSMKDLPGEMPDGLVIAAIPLRESPNDCLISRENKKLAELPVGAVIGTSSLRRQAQLLAARPDLTIRSIRGNIDTRLKKMHEGHYDAIVLATAGLARMGWRDLITDELSVETMLPAVGQGALAIQCREEDNQLISLLQTIHHPLTAKAVDAERAFLRRLEGGCHWPIAGYADVEAGQVQLTGLIGRPDGSEILSWKLMGSNEWSLGEQVAEELLQQGAKELLASIGEETVV